MYLLDLLCCTDRNCNGAAKIYLIHYEKKISIKSYYYTYVYDYITNMIDKVIATECTFYSAKNYLYL